MKKSVVCLIVLVLIIGMFSTTVFAGPPNAASQQDDNGGRGNRPARVGNTGDAADTGLGDTADISAAALGTSAPSWYKLSLDHPSSKFYYKSTSYIAPATGFYCFYSLTSQDTDIAFYRPGDLDYFDWDARESKPFSMWVFLIKDEYYEIDFFNRGSASTITYLVTTPLTLGDKAYTINPGGFSSEWLQAFDFVVPSKGNYSIHMTCPSGSKYHLTLWEGADYHWEEDPSTGYDYLTFNIIAGTSDISYDLYHTFSLEPGTYHFVLWMKNTASKTAPFTIAMDSAMTEGAGYEGSIAADDTLSVQHFIPAKKGYYSLDCNRSDAKITVISEAGQATDNYLVKDAAPGYDVLLEGGTKYYIYYATNGTAGNINYSANYILSDKCLLTGVNSPLSLGLSNHIVTGTVSESTESLAVTPVVSDYAVWKLCGSDGETVLSDSTIPLNYGLNTAYIKVTSENGVNTATYPVYVYRPSADTSPSILAFDAAYKKLAPGVTINSNVYSVVLGGTSSATLGGSTISWASPFTAEGAYVINATGGNGKTAQFTFAIDKTKPVITAKTIANAAFLLNGKTKYDVVVTVTGAETASMTRNGAAITWPVNNTFTSEGVYTAKATDKAGNETVFTFSIDKAPVVTATTQTSHTVLANNGYTAEAVKVEYAEQFLSTATLTRDAAALTWPAAGTTVSQDGKYYAYVRDAFGSSSSLTFYIDAASPKIEAVTKSKIKLTDEGITKESYVTVNVSDLTLKTKSVTKNGSSFRWPSSNKFTAEGVYAVRAEDMTGHISTLTFTIDRSKPIIACNTAVSSKALKSGSITSENVVISVTDRVGVSSSLKLGGTSVVWPLNNTVSASGIYTVTSTDKLGYTTTFTFIIDKTPPVITAVSGVAPLADGAAVNTDVVVSYTEANFSSKSAIKDGKSYSWPRAGKFTRTGRYTVTVKDKAGNSGTFTFTIDKTVPVISAKTTTKATVPNKGKTMYDVIVTITDAASVVKSAALDGHDIAWPADSKFTVEGEYQITATDSTSNKSVFSFRIDKPPVITVNPAVGAALSNNGFTAQNATISSSEKFLSSKTLKLNGTAIAWPTGNTVTAEGVYTVTIKDLYGSTSVFTFTIDKTKPVVTAKEASGTNVPDKAATQASSVTVTVAESNLASRIVTKDGVPITWPSSNQFTAEGAYAVTAKDKAGNETAFTFTIDRSALSITAKDEGNKTLNGGGYANSDVTVAVKGNSIAPTATKDKTNYPYPTDGVFTEEGTYVVTARGFTSNVSTFTFTIDLTPPVISAEDSDNAPVLSGDITNKSVQFTANDSITGSADISFQVNKDGSLISSPVDNTLTDEGSYSITAADEAGNKSAAFIFTIDKTGPVITASNSQGSLIENAYSKYDVTITVTDAFTDEEDIDLALYTVAIVGDEPVYTACPYPTSGVFTEDDYFAVRAIDAAGNITYFQFRVDKTAPVIDAVDSDLGVISTDDFTAKDVTVTVTGNDFAVSVNKNGASGYGFPAGGTFTEEGRYVVEAMDYAQNITTLIFTIDKTCPAITAISAGEGNIENGGTAHNDVTIGLTEANIASIVVTRNEASYYAYPDNGYTTCWDGTGYAALQGNGEYVISVADKAGNQLIFMITISM